MTPNLFDSSPDSAAWFTAHCDGGSRGNPGPSGFGAVVQDPDGHTVARLSQFLGIQTNNYAEYQGLLAVLDWALQNHVSHLRVISDSELMVNQMKGRYKVSSPTLRPLWEEARRRTARLEAFEMRHTLRGGNKEADRLANDAMDKGWKAKPPIPASQPVGGSPSQPVSCAPQAPAPGLTQPQSAKPPRQVLEGLVKNGVIHLIEGELPDGILVKIIRE